MQYHDYYKTLGVDRLADAATIKKAYRRLARKYHPDVSKESDAEEKFKTLGEAYEVLKDPEKRQAYDTLGPNWQDGENFQAPPSWTDASGHYRPTSNGDTFDAGGFSDFFSELFGQHQAGASQPEFRRQDSHAKLFLTLEQLVAGESVDIQINDASASGTKRLRVKVPGNLTDGDSFRLKNQGLQGDLYVEVRIIPHPNYQFDGLQVYSELEIPPWVAVLGGNVKVATLTGDVTMKVPQDSHTGRKLRLKGRGLPGTPNGDQLVTLTIQTPDTVSDDERAHYEALAKLAEEPREQTA